MIWESLLLNTLDRFIRSGTLTVHFASGKTARLGDGSGPEISVHLSSPDLPRKLLLNPELAMGEAYMDRTLTIEGDDLRGFLTLAIRNNEAGGHALWQKLLLRGRRLLRRLDQHNPLHRARANVEVHYDMQVDFYDLFMEEDKQYTCAYFREPGNTLEEAQANKKAHIAGKLLIEPGMRVLDIGCGWGGLAITLARDHGAHVVGITLSEVQKQAATARAAAAGVADKTEFRLLDYRHVNEQFDRITAVGMMEHVGQPHYRAFFKKLRASLTEDGIALIHFIGRSSPPDTLSPWFQKYIFPGGYAPALSEVINEVEAEKLVLCDLEVWRGHYERTLREWQIRFEANADKVAQMYDDRFVRMWRYYLIASELSFSEMHQVLFQMQLSRHQNAVPRTRDYLYSNAAARAGQTAKKTEDMFPALRDLEASESGA